jgi:outer membrane protein OmpA-like peptidoglycan-associated protein
MKKILGFVAIALLAFGAVGCRTAGPGDGPIELTPEDWDNPLAKRFDIEGGELIKDAIFEPVLFAYDSYQIADSEAMKIEDVASFMKSDKSSLLLTEGHCDERGSGEYNLSLGEYRALSIRAYLISLGIDSARVQTRSYGEEMPADPGHNESAWRLNRRVEFLLYRKK